MANRKSFIAFPDEYVMIDTETTGFSVEWDSMIEIGALKIRDGEVIDNVSQALDRAVENGVKTLVVQPTHLMHGFEYVGFDINFIREDLKRYFGQEMNNDYIDCMRIARKLFPDEKHHRLKDMRKIFNIDVDREHRASHDCIATKAVFEKLREVALDKYGSIEAFRKSFVPKGLKAGNISSQNTEFDVTHPLFGMTCVFTGTLEKMTRREAMQAVVDAGGAVGDNVTKDTNFLVLGNNDYCKTIKDGKSTKQKKAEALMLKGNDIAVIPENVFYEMLEN